MPPEELKALIEGLKKKWTETHKKFEEEGHISLIDTCGLKDRRLANEAKL